VVPRAVRERFGLIGGRSHEIELFESPDGILLRPAGAEVRATRDASGWVVFHSESEQMPDERLDPVALVDAERHRRTRAVSSE